MSSLAMTALGRVAVLFGGHSAEREISLKSGDAVLKALVTAGADVVGIDTGENIVEALQAQNFDRAFIALHGPGGEDGKVQGFLECMNVPYTGSGVLASALCMDKKRTKQLWQGMGLPTATFCTLDSETDWHDAMALLQGEAMVKPAHEGSSIGMSRVASAEQLKAAYFEAAKYDASVIAEQFITGAEYTVAILDGEALPPIRLQPNSSFYDFKAKYQANDTQYLCPCGLAADKESELKALALKAFDAVGAKGWGRVDVMADEIGNFYLLEVNTVPGMTSHSLVPMAAKAAGMSFDQLVVRIAQTSLV